MGAERVGSGAPRAAIAAGALLALVAIVASLGEGADPLPGLATIAYLLLTAGLPALAYVGSGIGWGRLFRPVLAGSADRCALQVALGLALLLSISHALGALGLLAAPVRLPVGAGVLLIGLALLAHQVLGHRPAKPESGSARAPWPAILALPGVAVLVVGACQAPGWLWASEAGGYDALSYHLQLPREWLSTGRITPLEHNVYSYLPGYVEAACTHLGAILGGPGAFIGGEGRGAMACQMLHGALTLLTAWLVARAVVAAGRRTGAPGEWTARAGALAGALVLATPWTSVVGSLAYNELGLAALGAGAMIAALDSGLSPARRGAITGLLVGVACGCKPTALLLVGLPAGSVLLVLAPRREWHALIAAGSLAGLVALAPWLMRNGLSGGNPVFPHLAGVFGLAHWTPEQAARYAAVHAFEGPWWRRAALLLAPDTLGPPGADGSRQRGLLHPQWLAFAPAVLVAAIVGLACRPTRRVAAALTVGLLALLIAWMFTTHLQSRFLYPAIVPGAILVGLAPLAPRSAPARRTLLGIAALVVGIQGGASVLNFARQRGGHPNAMLAPGVGARTGDAYRELMAGPDDRRMVLDAAAPETYCNLALPTGSKVYLLGDATPLYYLGPILYHTTWDRSPLGDAMRAAPDDPAAWTRALRSRGVDHVLLSEFELARLHASGWYDPPVTAQRARAWLDREGHLVKAWPEGGRYLFRLGGPPEPSEPAR